LSGAVAGPKVGGDREVRKEWSCESVDNAVKFPKVVHHGTSTAQDLASGSGGTRLLGRWLPDRGGCSEPYRAFLRLR
jgi:hypothetical protein